jgi:hypothetical protein
MEETMLARQWVVITVCLLIVLVLVGGCATPVAPTPTRAELPAGPEAEWNLVVIGDSTLWGLAEAFAAQIERDVGVQVAYNDCTVGGLSAGAVLKALETGESSNRKLASLPEWLAEAEVVVMFANPEDSIDPEVPLDLEDCFYYRAPGLCSPESFGKYTADVSAVWARILELRGDQPVILRAMDIYSPVVMPWNRYGVFEACTECWENKSDALRLAAEAHGIPFLSVYDAYNGADHTEDPREKGYIDRDGVHPSDLMAQHTAELLSAMGYEPTSGP